MKLFNRSQKFEISKRKFTRLDPKISEKSEANEARSSPLSWLKREKNLSCQILLLDGSDIKFTMDRKAYGEELLNKVFLYLDLVEQDYFGLQFMDHLQVSHWLDPTKVIKKQVKIGPPYTLSFRVKFYSSEPNNLREELTRYHFFLQLKRDVLTGKLPCPYETAVELSAYALQSELGDYNGAEHTPAFISEFRFVPDQTEKMEFDILETYKEKKNQTPAQAEINYLTKVKWLDLYGVDFHTVLGKDGFEYSLGLTPTGVLVFERKQKIGLFLWPKINRFDFRNKKVILVVEEDEYVTETGPLDESDPGPPILIKKEHTFVFRTHNYKAAKHLWKCAVQYHTFFRLIAPPLPSAGTSGNGHVTLEGGGRTAGLGLKGTGSRNTTTTAMKNSFFRMGSRFRYSGKTEFQATFQSKVRKSMQIERKPSQRYSRRPPKLTNPSSSCCPLPPLPSDSDLLSTTTAIVAPSNASTDKVEPALTTADYLTPVSAVTATPSISTLLTFPTTGERGTEKKAKTPYVPMRPGELSIQLPVARTDDIDAVKQNLECTEELFVLETLPSSPSSHLPERSNHPVDPIVEDTVPLSPSSPPLSPPQTTTTLKLSNKLKTQREHEEINDEQVIVKNFTEPTPPSSFLLESEGGEGRLKDQPADITLNRTVVSTTTVAANIPLNFTSVTLKAADLPFNCISTVVSQSADMAPLKCAVVSAATDIPLNCTAIVSSPTADDSMQRNKTVRFNPDIVTHLRPASCYSYTDEDVKTKIGFFETQRQSFHIAAKEEERGSLRKLETNETVMLPGNASEICEIDPADVVATATADDGKIINDLEIQSTQTPHTGLAKEMPEEFSILSLKSNSAQIKNNHEHQHVKNVKGVKNTTKHSIMADDSTIVGNPACPIASIVNGVGTKISPHSSTTPKKAEKGNGGHVGVSVKGSGGGNGKRKRRKGGRKGGGVYQNGNPNSSADAASNQQLITKNDSKVITNTTTPKATPSSSSSSTKGGKKQMVITDI